MPHFLSRAFWNFCLLYIMFISIKTTSLVFMYVLLKLLVHACTTKKIRAPHYTPFGNHESNWVPEMQPFIFKGAQLFSCTIYYALQKGAWCMIETCTKFCQPWIRQKFVSSLSFTCNNATFSASFLNEIPFLHKHFSLKRNIAGTIYRALTDWLWQHS